MCAKLFQIGPRGYVHAEGVTNVQFTPLSDRAARVTGIRLRNPSAADNWMVLVSGKELGRYYVDPASNQNVLGWPVPGASTERDLFTWYEEITGKAIEYPVPNGQLFEIVSRGGATANIEVEFEECQINDIHPGEINHFEGRHFRMPMWAFRAAAFADANEHTFDTEITPDWVPQLFAGVQVQAGYSADIWALFVNSEGVNTFSGAADHLSATEYLFAVVNGQRLFTRAAQDGIPAVGAPAAAGSANKVLTSALNRFPAFQSVQDASMGLVSPAIHIGPGVTSSWGYKCNGSFTGGADYSLAKLLALVDVTVG